MGGQIGFQVVMATIDPITLEVVTEGLISVVREMRATVFRTARSVAMDKTHGAVPVQSPSQPAKVDPAAGVAVKVTVWSEP